MFLVLVNSKMEVKVGTAPTPHPYQGCILLVKLFDLGAP